MVLSPGSTLKPPDEQLKPFNPVEIIPSASETKVVWPEDEAREPLGLPWSVIHERSALLTASAIRAIRRPGRLSFSLHLGGILTHLPDTDRHMVQPGND
jgi:hypothetical protein